MSAGSFVTSRYESDNGLIYRIRIQPETLTATVGGTPNGPPAGNITEAVTARSRGSRRAYGVTARKVTLRFTGDIPEGYSGDDVSIPILTPGLFNAIIGSAEYSGTYLGSPVIVVSKTAEQVR